MADQSELLVYVQLSDPDKVAALRDAAESAGLALGKRKGDVLSKIVSRANGDSKDEHPGTDGPGKAQVESAQQTKQEGNLK